MARGRPSDYTEELVEAILTRIADGESLRSICADEGMPNRSTVNLWRIRHADFCAQYARAREAQADAYFDDIQEIADNAKNDWMERNGEGDEGWQANGEHIQRSKLRIDARKWMAGKLRPTAYGDKQQHDHTSSDGSMTPKPVSVELIAKPIDDDSAN